MFYIDLLVNENNLASFGTSISDDLSYDSIGEKFDDRQNNYQINTGESNPPHSLRNFSKANDSDLSGVRIKKKNFKSKTLSCQIHLVLILHLKELLQKKTKY